MLALALLLAVSAAPTGALQGVQESADAFIGQAIVEVEYRGVVTLAEESMSFYLDIEPGRPFDPERLNAKIREFWDRDLIDDIRVDAEAASGGVRLIITIVERPELLSIDYQGLDKVKRNDIEDAADRERIELYEGLPLNRGELVRLQQVIKDVYSERGFRFAEVVFDIQQVSPSERRILVTVDEGNKVKIGRVDFEGNEIFGGGRLRSQMEKTRKSNLLTRIRKRDIYNPAQVSEDLENVRDLYRRFGYKDVQTGDPVVEVMRTGGEKRRLRIIVPIEEGPRWKLGEIRLQGNEVLADDVLIRTFEEPKGGWLRSDVVEKGVERIREFYQNTGYIFSRVETEVIERDDLVADVLVKVQENDQFRVGRIEFSGNTKTRDKVLRREVRIQEGMVFNSGALKNSLLKINQLEFFKINEDDPVELDYDTENKLVNLVIKGDEAERTELQFGGGYSEIDGFFGQAAIRTRNFLGRGETLGVNFQQGRFRDLLDVSYFVPWFRDRPQSVGIQAFDRDLDFDLLADQRFLQKERGFVLTYGRSFRLFEGLSFSYTFSEFEDFRSQRFFLDPNEPDGQTFSQSFEFNKSSLSASYRYDSHDSRLEPTRGKRLAASVEYAGGPLGGENYFVRTILEGAYTRPITNRAIRTVGRVNLELGYITPFGTDDDGFQRELFFNDRFLLGGEQSVRGYNFRSVWARDPDTGLTIRDINGFPQGGTRMGQLNLEYHYLVGVPFRIVFYADFGNVWSEGQEIDLESLRKVAGVELRINVPLFGAPLRFIYASNLDPYDNLPLGEQERFDSFDFSIGVSF